MRAVEIFVEPCDPAIFDRTDDRARQTDRDIVVNADAGQDMLDAAAKLLDAADVPFTCEVVAGDPAQAMLDLIGTHEVDMVVMGTRALGWIREAIEGSTSRRLRS